MTAGSAISTALSIALLLPASAIAQQTERERRAADTSTAVLQGTVFRGGSRQPLANVPLKLRSVPDHRLVAETTTDMDGGFQFTKLRAGGYRVLVAHDDAEAYLGSLFVGVGRVVSVTFMKGTILAGRVLNERGAPVSGVQVCALHYNERGVPSQASLSDRYATTELDGTFLIHDATASSPGRFLLAASPDGCALGVQRPQERLTTLPASFYPDVLDAAEAAVIDAGPEQDRTGLVIRMKRGAATRIEGRVLGFENQTVVPARAILEPPPGVVSLVRTATISADGRFAFYGLRPGTYKIIVPPRADRTSAQVYGISTFEVRGEAVLPVALKMQSALWIGGDVSFDDSEQPYFGVRTYSSVTANPVYPRRDVGMLLPSSFSLIDARSRFMITGLLPIGYVITTQGFQTLGWLPVEAVATRTPGGAPLADAFSVPLTLNPSEGIFGMKVKFTARASTIVGRVVDTDGSPVGGGAVVIFAAADGATIQGKPSLTVRVNTNGDFESPVLIVGEYLVAIGQVKPIPVAQQPEYLAALRKAATPVTVKTGEKTPVTLTVR